MKTILTHYKNTPYSILVDDEDYEFLSQFNWNLIAQDGKITSAFTRTSKSNIHLFPFEAKVYTNVYIHRLILGVRDKHTHIDHIDRNPLNNQKSNLRKCTIVENNFNRMRERQHHDIPFKGVYIRDKRKNMTKPYCVKVGFKGHRITVDTVFETMEEAAKVYDELARLLHGEFAALNFPD